MKHCIFVLLWLLALVSLPLTAVVKINGIGTTYTTIQAAVDAASDMDVLHVSTGEYHESVSLTSTNRLTIRGGYAQNCVTYLGGDLTTIRANGSTAVSVDGTAVTLDGLHLTGGTQGLQVQNGGAAFCIVCRVYGNTRGMYVNGSLVTLDHSTVHDNGGGTTGGGAHLFGGATLMLLDNQCAIRSNTAVEGAGVAVHGSTLIVKNSADIYANGAYARGGGILLQYGSTAVVAGAGTYVGHPGLGGNIASNGAGIYAESSTVIISNGASVAQNFAYEYGGGIFVTDSVLQIDGATVGTSLGDVHNEAHYGGGVYAAGSLVLVENGSYIQNGRAALHGGGIEATNSILLLAGGSYVGHPQTNIANQAGYWGGGMHLVDCGLFCVDAHIVGNMAGSYGGGINMTDAGLNGSNLYIAGNSAGQSGGGIYAINDNCILYDSVIQSNRVMVRGGGLYWVSPYFLRINGTDILANHADGDGGGIYTSSEDVMLQRSRMQGNTADKDGGGLYTEFGDITIEDTDIFDNHVGGNGGGIYAGNVSAIHLAAENTNVMLRGNTAQHGGGVCLDDGATVRITTDGSRLYMLDYNTANSWGGGLCALSASDIEVEGRVQIVGNEAEYGGGMCLLDRSECFMSDTNGWGPLLALNIAANDGGGTYVKDSATHLVMRNTTIGYQHGGNVALRDIGNGGGGGIAVIDHAQLLATNVRFEDNRCYRAGGGLYVYNAWASIDSEVGALTGGIYPQSAFVGNAATNPSVLTFGQGGGAYVEEDGVLNLSHVALAGNYSHYGSALASAQNGLCTAWNCLVVQNHTTGAGAIWGFAATNSCIDCTIADNGSNGVVNTGSPSDTVLGSCIVWGHAGAQVSPDQDVYSSAVQGGYPGAGNISVYPVFMDTNALDYRLDVSSPCIDTGYSFWYITNDIIGAARPYGSDPDMGCYEFVPEPVAVAALAIAIAAVTRVRRTLS